MKKKIYGLLGRKLGHSYSVPIHRELGNRGYSLIELEPGQLPEFFQREDIGGVNVTIPYKRKVMQYCHVLSPDAQDIGSVNTIVCGDDGRLCGYNSDAYGFLQLVRTSGISLEGRKTVILGSGGVSLTVQAVAKRLGASEVVVISRQGENNYENLFRHSDAQVIVNATPVGMYPDVGKAPADLKLFPDCVGVLDLIFNPARTALLIQAGKLGIPNANGLLMLVAQAKEAEEHFFGRSIDDRENLRIYNKLRSETENIVLIGMPGCGKSTVGAALAELSGRKLIDVDIEIEKMAGCSISEIFAQNGEESFRGLEREAISAAGLESGNIIASGGGVIKDERNYSPLHQNGRIYHLERDLALLPLAGRPLSMGTNLHEMYHARLPAYRRFRDRVVDNNQPIDDTAAAIWRDFCENAGCRPG